MFGKKSPVENDTRVRARHRLATLADREILSWADQAGSGVAKALDDYRRTQDDGCLHEAASGIEQLAGAIDVLVARQR